MQKLALDMTDRQMYRQSVRETDRQLCICREKSPEEKERKKERREFCAFR